MRVMERATKMLEEREAADVVSLCSLLADGRTFGIDTHKIREVLGPRVLERVPLAAAYIGGVMPYRGEVLTTVSLRSLLGLPMAEGLSCVLVLDGEDGEERFGLMVDRVGGVMLLERKMLAENPTTLDEVSKTLYSGAYRMADQLLIQLDPGRLNPVRLGETGLFRHGVGQAGRGRGAGLAAGKGDLGCGR